MNTHVKVVGWLWIIWGALSILMMIGGLILVNLNVPDPQDALLVTGGGLCFSIPGIVASFLAGYGLLKFKNWARIVAIVLSFVYMLALPIGTAVGIYTLIIMFSPKAVALFRGETAPAETAQAS
jgi:hypothetical protein